MEFKIAVIKGDGVGPEVMDETLKVMDKIASKHSHKFHKEFYIAGGVAIDEEGTSLPSETLKGAKESDGVLLGAVGGPKWDNLKGEERPEKALLTLRKELGLYSNLRPCILFPQLKGACPLKKELVEEGVDLLVIRELTGGIYFGKKGTRTSGMGISAFDIEEYSEEEVRRIARTAFKMAGVRKKKVVSVDKANVLESSRLWRRVVNEVHENYKDVELSHMYVDNMAMQLIRDPRQFDVILTNNMFGDILSDEASQITGSIGMLPSASLGEKNFGMYEPVHGSAPDIAGKDIVNPFACILSFAMMLKYSFNLQKEASEVEKAVGKVLSDGYRTKDIFEEGRELIGTKRAGDLVLGALD